MQTDLMSFYMLRALELAEKARELGDIPVGALVVHNGEIISEAYNSRENQNNPVGHAELLALSEASKKLGRWRLLGCTLYVTLEPCVMCAGAVVLSRVDKVVYGARDPKGGAVESLYKVLSDERLNHRPEVVSGVEEEKCSILLKNFFAQRRADKK